MLSIYRSILVSIAVLFVLTACGGGGGGDPKFSLPDTFNAVAVSPGAATGTNLITGTIDPDTEGIIYVFVDVQGPAVQSMDNFVPLGIDTFSTVLRITSPAILGPGIYNSSITVHACLNSPTCASGELEGSPQQVEVTLEVQSSVKMDTVMPRNVIATQVGEVVIRGHGFLTNSVTGVAFGGNNAITFANVSDTEIHATFPALAEGLYSVELSNVSGPLAFAGNLNVVGTKSYTASTLTYPTSPQQTLALVYDAEREALLVGARYFLGGNTGAGNTILRYQFSNGAFVSMSSVNVPFLRDFTMSPDGKELLALTDTQVIHLNPATMIQIRSSVSNHPGTIAFKNIVAMNDGMAIITSRDITGNNFILPIPSSEIVTAGMSCHYNSTPGVGLDGSYASIVQGPLSPAPNLCQYDSSTGVFSDVPLNASQPQCLGSRTGKCVAPTINANATNILVTNSFHGASIYDPAYNMLGGLPDAHGDTLFSPDGNIVYSYLSGGLMRSFDLTQPTVNDLFPEIGAGITLVGDPGNAKMTMTPNGDTIFIAGENLIAIQPLP